MNINASNAVCKAAICKYESVQHTIKVTLQNERLPPMINTYWFSYMFSMIFHFF